MFGNRTSRWNKSERLAADAWDNLSAAVESAGKTTKRRAAGMYGEASDRVGSGTKEARRRAGNALDALAGRKPRTNWGLLAAIGLVGAAFGWLVTTVGKQFTSRSPEPLPLSDEFPEDISSELLKR
jgi:hypothetical protein